MITVSLDTESGLFTASKNDAEIKFKHLVLSQRCRGGTPYVLTGLDKISVLFLTDGEALHLAGEYFRFTLPEYTETRFNQEQVGFQFFCLKEVRTCD